MNEAGMMSNLQYLVKLRRTGDGGICFIRSDQIVGIFGDDTGSTIYCQNGHEHQVTETPVQVRDRMAVSLTNSLERWATTVLPAVAGLVQQHGSEIKPLLEVLRQAGID
jgi:hypothetical protein